jgi:hypothetical protein
MIERRLQVVAERRELTEVSYEPELIEPVRRQRQRHHVVVAVVTPTLVSFGQEPKFVAHPVELEVLRDGESTLWVGKLCGAHASTIYPLWIVSHSTVPVM